MIIADKNAQASEGRVFKILVIAALVILGVFLLYPSRYLYQNTNPRPNSYYCDHEVVKGDYFLSGALQFKAAKTQSGDYSRSGKYACFLKKSNDNQYGVGFDLPAFQPGESYKASVWRYREQGGNDGFLVVSADDPKQYYKSTSTLIKSVEGWELLEIIFRIPYYQTVDKISVYVYSQGTVPIYFDDLLIEKTGDPLVLSTQKWTPQQLNLKLDKKAFNKLENKRTEAFRNGLLETTDRDWVKARLSSNEDSKNQKVSLRLKGDWLDHLESDKWSFRVKMKEGDTYQRLRYFSLHTPSARSHLHEWVLHQLFQQEDILTTYYDFLLLDINGEKKGVYAIEEHFDKVLLERQKRREGPILKLSEEGFWAGMKRQLTQVEDIDHEIDMPSKRVEGATASPFQVNRTLRDTNLNNQLEEALLLLRQYQSGAISADAIFDLEKMAQFFAICDALGAYHGIAWHNQRFYFNPVTAKLEPIGFDGFSDAPSPRNAYLGMGALNRKKAEIKAIEDLLFLDTAFTARYAFYLYEYTSRSFLNTFFASIEEELKQREALLETEFEAYRFDLERVMINAQRMHSIALPFDEYSVKAYTQRKGRSSKLLKVGNLHGLPVQILGTGRDAESMTTPLPKPYLLEAFYKRTIYENRQQDSTVTFAPDEESMLQAFIDQHPVRYHELEVPSSAAYLFYKPLGIDTVFHSSLLQWPLTERLTVRQSIFKTNNLKSNPIFSINDRAIFFKKGKHQSAQDIIIPEGYTVVFEAGCQLDLIKKAKFIARSPIESRGTERDPVRIFSSDKSASGFTILETGQKSTLRYTIFDQLNTLREKGWTLTGAVTFYEADVDIERCIFKNNHCEDGLNIIRSDFLLKNSQVSNTYGDGFDADFCKGTIEKVNFLNTKNDGMDFSGSVIRIKDALVDGSGDKGISVGEDSDVYVSSINIKNAVIAVASKDLSMLAIDKIDIENCQQGFTAYQKKPEFGGASIVVKQYKGTDIKRLHNIRKDCSLQLEGKLIKGEQLIQ